MFDNINTRSITFNLIAINVLLFVTAFLFPNVNHYLSLQYIFNNQGYVSKVLSGTIDAAQYPNLTGFITYNNGFISEYGFQPVQLISHMFMHGGLAHIFFNMFALLSFGAILERVWGAKRFLMFYMITGLGAVILHVAVQAFIIHGITGSISPTIAQLDANPSALSTYFSSTVGASGAVFGLLIAFAMLFPNTELMLLFIPFPVKAKYFVPIYIVIELYLGIARYGGDNVAHFAHLGGALFGFILVKLWNRNRNSLY